MSYLENITWTSLFSKEFQFLVAVVPVKGLDQEQQWMLYLVLLLRIHLWDLVHLGTQIHSISLLLGTSYKTTNNT
jgi:hypothetical protein